LDISGAYAASSHSIAIFASPQIYRFYPTSLQQRKYSIPGYNLACILALVSCALNATPVPVNMTCLPLSCLHCSPATSAKVTAAFLFSFHTSFRRKSARSAARRFLCPTWASKLPLVLGVADSWRSPWKPSVGRRGFHHANHSGNLY